MAYTSKEKFRKYMEQKGLFPQESKSDYADIPDEIIKKYALGGSASKFDNSASVERKLPDDLDKELDAEFDKVNKKISQEQIDAAQIKKDISSGNTAVAVSDSKDREIAYNKKRDFVNAMGSAWSGVGHFNRGGFAEDKQDFSMTLQGKQKVHKRPASASYESTKADISQELSELEKSKAQLEKDIHKMSHPEEEADGYADGGVIPAPEKVSVSSPKDGLKGDEMLRKKADLVKAILKEKRKIGMAR